MMARLVAWVRRYNARRRRYRAKQELNALYDAQEYIQKRGAYLLRVIHGKE